MTATRVFSRTVEYATTEREGLEVMTYRFHYCDSVEEKGVRISMKEKPNSNHFPGS